MTLRKLRPYLIGVPLGLLAWVAIGIGVTLFPPAGRPVAIFALDGTAAGIAAVVAAGGEILEVRDDRVIAISDDAGFVARLYGEAPLIAVLADGGCGFGKGKRTPSA